MAKDAPINVPIDHAAQLTSLAKDQKWKELEAYVAPAEHAKLKQEHLAKAPKRQFAGHPHYAHSFVTVETTGDGALNGHAYRAGELIDVPESALDHFQRTGTGKLKPKVVKS